MDTQAGTQGAGQVAGKHKRAETAHIPVIALTAHALASDRDKSIAIGCVDFDTKPVDLTRLLGKIRACLKASKQ